MKPSEKDGQFLKVQTKRGTGEMKSLIMGAALVLLAQTPSYAQGAGHTVANVENVSDGSGQCAVVTVANGTNFSLPKPSSPFHPEDANTWGVNMGYLAAGALSYANPPASGPTRLYWLTCSPDPYCYGYAQIVNLSFTLPVLGNCP